MKKNLIRKRRPIGNGEIQLIGHFRDVCILIVPAKILYIRCIENSIKESKFNEVKRWHLKTLTTNSYVESRKLNDGSLNFFQEKIHNEVISKLYVSL